MSEEISLKIPIDQNEQQQVPFSSILYKVSLEGDVVGLKRLLEDDELVLDRLSAVTCFHETPLHVAAMRGHCDFARALLRYKPRLAGESDSLLRLPLHWAAEKGYTNIVHELLQIKSSPDIHKDACFSRDQDGRIPLHLGVMNERIDVVIELIRTRPESILEKVENGGTILHLCVKYNRLESLKLLADSTKGHELVNEKDDHGNTILHLAAIFKQVEITKYLVSESIDINANASNTSDFTALDAIEHSPMDSKALEIKNILLEAGIQKKTDNSLSVIKSTSSESESSNIILKGCLYIGRKCKKIWNTYINNFNKKLESARGSILIAATVTATLTFQAGINPPDFAKKGADDDVAYNAAYLPNLFFPAGTGKYGFWYHITWSLVFSLLTILFMLSGIPFRNKFSSVLLVVVMAEVVLNISNVYLLAAASNITEKNRSEYTSVETALFVMAYLIPVVYWLILFIHVFNLVMSMVFKIFKYVKKCIVCCCLCKN